MHVAGSGHVTLSHSPCARTIILRFLSTLNAGDTSCASVPIPAFATADYPLTVRDATPRRPLRATGRRPPSGGRPRLPR